MTIREFAKACTPTLYKSVGISMQTIDGCTFGKSGMPAALLNAVLSCKTVESKLDDAVDKVIRYYQDENLPHSWWLEASQVTSALHLALVKRGLQLLGDFPCMALELSSLRNIERTKELSVETVSTMPDLDAWSHVVCKAFDLQPPIEVMYASLFRNCGEFVHLIGKKNGKAVTAGSLLCTENGAYICNVGTVEGERNKGYATALSYELLQLAKRKQFTRVALISSPMEASFYQKFGFECVDLFKIYAT